MTPLQARLLEIDACDDACDWLGMHVLDGGSSDPVVLWREVPRGDWLVWLLRAARVELDERWIDAHLRAPAFRYAGIALQRAGLAASLLHFESKLQGAAGEHWRIDARQAAIDCAKHAGALDPRKWPARSGDRLSDVAIAATACRWAAYVSDVGGLGFHVVSRRTHRLQALAELLDELPAEQARLRAAVLDLYPAIPDAVVDHLRPVAQEATP